MDTKTRKLEIIERVIHLDDETDLSMIEQVLEMLETAIPGEDDIPPMPPRSAAEIKARYAQSLREVGESQGHSQEEIVALTQQWRQREPV